MLSHVFIGTNDPERAMNFYRPIMETLGYPLKFVDQERGWAVWTSPGGARPYFLVGRPFDGEPALAGNGQMIALLAPSRAAVDEVYALAMSGGGRDDGPPGLRPQYHGDYYGAYFRDPDGCKLCVCRHDPD